jgi:hypothetical protein
MQNFDTFSMNIPNQHPYIFAGGVATLIYFLVLLFLNKKSFNSSLINSLVFGFWFSVGWFIWNYISIMIGRDVNIVHNMNRYTIGSIGTIVWFLYSLLIQKRSLNRAIISAGMFLIFYIVAEVIYILFTEMRV